MEHSQDTSNTASRPVRTALSILETLAESDESMTLTELCRMCGIPKATGFRYVAELERSGYVLRDRRTQGLRLGPMVLRLARRFTRQDETLNVARGVLPRLAQETGETAHLGVLQSQHVVYIDLAESPQRIRAFISRGERLPAHCVASGKAILAVSPAEVVNSVIGAGLRRFTEATTVTPERLEEDLEACRRRGYSTALGEWMPEVAGISAALFSPAGDVTGAIGVSCPLARTDAARVKELGKIVKQYASEISETFDADPNLSATVELRR